MKLDRRRSLTLGDLGTPFQASSATAAEGFVGHDDAARIGFVAFPDAVHTRVDARSTMEAVFLIDHHPVFRKGLALFTNFLVKPCSDDVQKTIKLRALFNLLKESRHLLEREGNGGGEVFLKLVEKLSMFQARLAFPFALAAVEAEIEGEDVR
jgi:hypothetical protein